MVAVQLVIFGMTTVLGSFVPTGRIVGGYSTSIEQRPFQASLVLYDDPICGGSIIKADIVLTAAHCIADVSESNLQVRVGSSLRKYGGRLVKVRKLKFHENYIDATSGHDVGLVWLQEALKFNLRIQMIGLPRQGETFVDGLTAVVSGWGLLQPRGVFPDILQESVIPLLSRDLCNAEYRGMITQDMICAGVDRGGRDACQMDSGGPLTVGNKQVGIVSFGYGCAVPYFAGIYTNIANFREWIDGKIAANV